MSDEIFDFEKLEVYKKSLDFIDDVYRILRKFPSEERFGLCDQFRRAAVSIPLNIAEGSGGTKGEFMQYLKISRRSVKECIAIMAIALRQKYIDSDLEDGLRGKCVVLSKMLMGLMKSLNKD